MISSYICYSIAKVFAVGLHPSIGAIRIQDPYLRNENQLNCLRLLMKAIEPLATAECVPVAVVTKLSDQERDRFALSPVKQRKRIEEIFQEMPRFKLNLEFRTIRDPMHARFVFICGPGEEEVLFYLDRGLDLLDPKTGRARGGPILKFAQPDNALKRILLGDPSKP